MPLATLKITDHAPYAPRLRPQPASEAEEMAAVPSPVHTLQQQLRVGSAIMPLDDAGRWPIGRSVALIVGSSIVLWAAALEITASLVRAIA